LATIELDKMREHTIDLARQLCRDPEVQAFFLDYIDMCVEELARVVNGNIHKQLTAERLERNLRLRRTLVLYPGAYKLANFFLPTSLPMKRSDVVGEEEPETSEAGESCDPPAKSDLNVTSGGSITEPSAL
jgi:uncharacterized protein YuzB (UPF0349 family)